jgi:hypothetical protein
MKPAFSYFIGSLLLLGGVTACKNNDKDSAPHPDFFIQATKDGAPWTATGSSTFSKSNRQFYVFGQTGDAVQSELLSLGFSFPAAPQLTPVQPLRATWVTVLGGDVVTNSYATDAANLPSLEITRLDTVAKVVEGRFTTTLLREKRWTSQEEVLRFTDGSFRVHYNTVP